MELIIGHTYRIRLTNGAWVEATFNHEERSEGHTPSNQYRKTPTRTHYSFTNLSTGRQITIKSKRRIKEVSVQ